jgi:signal transduction histidine kinase
VSLTPSYLASWPGRFRHPRLWVEAAAAGSEDQLTAGPAGDPANHDLVTALLKDVAAGLDEPRALAYLLEQGELPAAASFIDDSPWLRSDPAAAQEAGRRLLRRRREAAEAVSDAVELARSRAEAAGVRVPDLPEVGGDELFRLPLLWNWIAAANAELDDEVEAARLEAEERTDENQRALSEILLAAWRQRISRGQLVTAERLLAAGGEDVLPPDAVPPLRAWDPTVNASATLDRRWHRPRDAEWPTSPAGQLLLESYQGLRHDSSAEAAESFCSALVEFLGGTAARGPRAYPGGYLFRLDLSSVGSLVPLAWLSDVRVVVRTDDEPIPPAIAAEARLIVVDAVSGTDGRRGRSNLAVLAASDLIRLSTAPDHRGLQLLRLVGRSWTSHAAGVRGAEALSAFLGGPESLAWIRLAWLVDVLGLGGAELTRELTNETGIHPAGLSVLLDLVLRSNRDISHGHVARIWQTLDARSRLVDAVLPSATADRAARVVFLAALAADGFDAPLQLADLELSIAVEGGDAPASLLERGLADLASHPLTEVTDEGVRLLRCAVLARLREDAPAMLLELLAALASDGPADHAWARHRWALLPDGDAGGALEDLLRRRQEAIERAAASDVPLDSIAVIDLLAGDLAEAHPTVELDLDLPGRAPTTAPPEALRTILAELLQNAINELAAAGRVALRVAVHADGEDVIIDVVDDGNGVRRPNPHAVLRPDRRSRAEPRGHGLPDAEQLARQIDGQLVLVTPIHADPLNGAHFRLTVRRGESRPN